MIINFKMTEITECTFKDCDTRRVEIRVQALSLEREREREIADRTSGSLCAPSLFNQQNNS